MYVVYVHTGRYVYPVDIRVYTVYYYVCTQLGVKITYMYMYVLYPGTLYIIRIVSNINIPHFYIYLNNLKVRELYTLL